MRLTLSCRSAERFPTVQVRAANTPMVRENVLMDAAVPDEVMKTFTMRSRRPSPAALLATLNHVVTSIGAPSKTSGHQKWNGTAEILKAMPTHKANKPSVGRIPIDE